MGWDIKAGKKAVRIAHVLAPKHEHIFSNPFAYSESEWSAACRECVPELYLLCCASDIWPTYTPKEAAQIADFLEKITEPTNNVKKLQTIFFHARRYRANVYFN